MAAAPARAAAALAAALVLATDAGSARPAADWTARRPVPTARAEVTAAGLKGEVVVTGGFTQDALNTALVEAYSPVRDTWRRLPPLPVAVDHAASAAAHGVLYVAGGYARNREKLDRVFAFRNGRWASLPRLPAPRGAAGAAVAGGKLYVVGGVGLRGPATTAFAFDLAKRRWKALPGPTPREHLAVVAARGAVYALGGRTAGFDTNLATVEMLAPGATAWRALPSLPTTRGGTGAAVACGSILSTGGEQVGGTIGRADALDLGRRPLRWRQLPDLPTPRHGLGVVGLGNTVFVAGGGTVPGLSVSRANESIALC